MNGYDPCERTAIQRIVASTLLNPTQTLSIDLGLNTYALGQVFGTTA